MSNRAAKEENRTGKHDGAAPAAPAKRGYLHDITIAKGLGIFLVVLGHVVTGEPPKGNDWYAMMRTALYAFHMPFFIYLSGFIFFYTASHLKAWQGFWSFFARRAERLLVPFALFGLIIVVGKHVASAFIHVDNLAPNFATDLVNLFWNTGESAAKSVWYVFVLFEMTLFAVIAMRLVKSPLFWFVIAVPLSFVPMVPVLYLDRFFLYLPYFFVGGLAIARSDGWGRMMDRWLWLWLVVFAGVIVATRMAGIYNLSLIACGLASIPALHGICRLPVVQRVKWLDLLGRYSFPIYLLNTVCIGLAKGLLLLVMPWDGVNFLIFLPVLLAAGIVGPIAAKVLIFRRSAYIDKITD
ncbi:acyltransferase family protein [Sphingobium fluviale]|uniref:Acyltransferase n=1 Tax=Sphingobium fluviale TaxID=2506423 RepID=A0A4Q1KNM2_9SPHN|nr:acyltransferase [Sphingobium fluviale]RXR30434.1 acyltransferase [Sphingobium fluviale]